MAVDLIMKYSRLHKVCDIFLRSAEFVEFNEEFASR